MKRTAAARSRWRYNEEHGIVPKTIVQRACAMSSRSPREPDSDPPRTAKRMSREDSGSRLIKSWTKEMKNAAKLLRIRVRRDICATRSRQLREELIRLRISREMTR